MGRWQTVFVIEGRVRNKGELRRGRRKNINCGQMRGRGEGEAKSGLGWIVEREILLRFEKFELFFEFEVFAVELSVVLFEQSGLVLENVVGVAVLVV